MAFGLTTPLQRDLPQGWAAAGIVIVATALLATLVYAYETSLALAGIIGVVGLITMLLFPELATLVVIFLLYSNIPSVLLKLYGVPDVVAGSFFLLLGIPLVHFTVIRRQPLKTDAVLVCMVVLLCAMVVSTLDARDKSIAIGRIQKYVLEGMVLYWLILNTVRTPTVLRRAIWAALAAATMLGSMSIYQSATGNFGNRFGGLAERNLEHEEISPDAEPVARTEDKVRRAMRADGPQLGNNRYAQVMLVLVPLAVYLFRTSRRRIHRALALTGAVVTLVGGVGLTYSRGAYLAGILMVIAATFVVRWVRPAHLVVCALTGLLLLPVVAPLAVKRMTTLSAVADLDNPTVADGAMRGRATEMLAALLVLLDHPVAGVGPGQYMPFYSVEYHEKTGLNLRDLPEQRRAHMLYFEIGAEGGILGLASFLVIPIVLLRRLRSSMRYWRQRQPEHADLCAALILSFVGFLATAVFLSHAFYRYYWFLVAVAGTTLALLRLEAARLTAHERERTAARDPNAAGRPLHGRVTLRTT